MYVEQSFGIELNKKPNLNRKQVYEIIKNKNYSHPMFGYGVACIQTELITFVQTYNEKQEITKKEFEENSTVIFIFYKV